MVGGWIKKHLKHRKRDKNTKEDSAHELLASVEIGISLELTESAELENPVDLTKSAKLREPVEPFRLLALPGELRNLIYSFVDDSMCDNLFYTKDGFLLPENPGDVLRDGGRSASRSLLLVNHQIQREFSDYLIRRAGSTSLVIGLEWRQKESHFSLAAMLKKLQCRVDCIWLEFQTFRKASSIYRLPATRRCKNALKQRLTRLSLDHDSILSLLLVKIPPRIGTSTRILRLCPMLPVVLVMHKYVSEERRLHRFIFGILERGLYDVCPEMDELHDAFRRMKSGDRIVTWQTMQRALSKKGAFFHPPGPAVLGVLPAVFLSQKSLGQAAPLAAAGDNALNTSKSMSLDGSGSQTKSAGEFSKTVILGIRPEKAN